MLWAIIAWLYFAGLIGFAFVLIDAGNVRTVRATLFLITWPISVPVFAMWTVLS